MGEATALEPQPQQRVAPRSCRAVLLAPPSHTPFPGQAPQPGLPASAFMRISDLRPYQASSILPHLWSLSRGTSEPHRVWEESRPIGPGRLTQEEPLGPARGLLSVPTGQSNPLPHQHLWPCDKGEHSAHDEGHGSFCIKSPGCDKGRFIYLASGVSFRHDKGQG